MGSGISTGHRENPSTRMIPREPVKEKFYVKEIEIGYPPARPPSIQKKDIYSPKENLVIYDNAICTPKKMEQSWSDLVTYLTSLYRTDIEKVRSLFTWLGTQDIDNEDLRDVSPDQEEDSPRRYKRLIKERNGSYAAMFALLCRNAGIKCVIVNGISKGVGYQVGDTDVKHLRDRWNAVFIEGWRLIHPLWAFKSVYCYTHGQWSIPESEEDIAARFPPQVGETPHNFNEKYFLVDPSDFIHICFPDNKKWQLCTTQMTLEKWTGMPHFQLRYFQDGYRMEEYCYSSMLTADDNGVCSVVIKAPDQKEDFQLVSHFYINHVISKPQVTEAVYLKRFLLMSRDVREKKWTFELRLPVEGIYKLSIFGGPSQMRKLPWICDVGMKSKVAPCNVKPYPINPDFGFGPVTLTEHSGLVEPSHPSGMIFINPRQEYHITFVIKRSLDTYGVLVSPDFPKARLKEWCQSKVNNPSTVHVLDIMIKVMEEGEFGLQIFVKQKDSKESYTNVCNYYLSTGPQREYGKTSKKHNNYTTATEVLARKWIKDARKGNDLDSLKNAVQTFEDQGLRDQDGTYGKATKKLAYLELSRNLRDAINRRKLEILDKAIKDAEESDHTHLMMKLLARAKEERELLLTQNTSDNKFIHAILDMKQTTISELLSYNKPIPIINDVLVAFLLVLGEDKDSITAWDNVKATMRKTGKESVMRKIQAFDRKLPVASVLTVKKIVDSYDENTVRAASVGAATFYVWTKSVIEDSDG